MLGWRSMLKRHGDNLVANVYHRNNPTSSTNKQEKMEGREKLFSIKKRPKRQPTKCNVLGF